ncbi:MAG: DoxX family protein [Gemmatimonadaceae bacterium]|nr:DoxX family protein [Gemmatimonadaceae bacterium]
MPLDCWTRNQQRLILAPESAPFALYRPRRKELPLRTPLNESHVTFAHAALRIAAGLAFCTHGAQKLLGWFGGTGPNGGTVELMSRFGAAGVIELVGGLCLVVGFRVRWVAFLASGEMAVAYFWMHAAGAGSIWWWSNRGELVMIYSFVWLLFAAWGAGPYSVDAALDERGKA